MSDPKRCHIPARKRTRVRAVEYEPGWGWIARDPDGNEVLPDFRWASRSVARDVAYTARLQKKA